MGNLFCTDIQMLSSLEAVRKRPGMYLNLKDPLLANQLLQYMITPSLLSAAKGETTRLRIRLRGTSVWVEDDGPGISVEPTRPGGPRVAERYLTELVCGAPDNSMELALFDFAIVNAVSSSFDFATWRDGVEWGQSFKKGIPTTSMQEFVSMKEEFDPTPYRGISCCYELDPDILGSNRTIDVNSLLHWLTVNATALTVDFRVNPATTNKVT